MDIRVASVVLLTLICIFTDLKYRKIYNHFTFSAVILGLGFNGVINGWGGVVFSLQGFFVGGIVLLVFFMAGGVGAGDVKYLAAAGSLLGAGFVFRAAVTGIIIGGIGVLMYMFLTKRLWVIFRNIANLFRYMIKMGKLDVTSLQKDKLYIPYGVFLGVGVLLEIMQIGVLSQRFL